jgi:L-threonylcarbamoyladenylate synthase
VVLVEGEAGLAEALARESGRRRVGVLLPEEWPSPGQATVVALTWASWSDPEALARELYRGLRALDETGVEVILCPLPPAEGIGLAVRDRLHKAAK